MKKERRDTEPEYKETIPIKGMHCASCELLIADELESIKGVFSATASLKTNSATIISDSKISSDDIETAIKNAGYEIGSDTKRPFLTKNPRVWTDFAIGLMVVFGLYLLFKFFGIDALVTSNADAGGTGMMALIVGLTAGFSTCMALIGGLVVGVASKYAENHPAETAMQKFRPHLFFNAGRILSFVILGAVIGAIGSVFALQGTLLGLLIIAAGIVMLLIGLQLTELSPKITRGVTLPSGISKRIGLSRKKEWEYSRKNALILGAATFFLPCGFTQAMQLLAVSTGDPVQAAIIMGAFALGTAPGLLGLGGLTSVVKGAFAQRFFRVVGVAVVAMALVNFSSGFTLAGFGNYLNPSALLNVVREDRSSEGSVKLNTIYTVRKDIVPNKFTAKVGEKTTLLVDVKENGQGCMSTIMIIGLDDRPQYLKKGEILELTFTPKKPGDYIIACAMGVWRGNIIVTE